MRIARLKTSRSDSGLRRRVLCLFIGALIIGIAWLCPVPEGLSTPGKMAIALMVAGIFLWITEPIPVAISGMVLMIMMPVFSIMDYGTAVWTGFISNVIFFILASFGISAALLKTKIPTKIVFALLRIAKGNSRATVLAFMVATSIVSLFISDLPCTALFTAIAVSSILKVQSAEQELPNLGKSLIIGITYASVAGGQGFLVGSAMYVMSMNMLKAFTGIEISFLDWTFVCFPLSLILLAACWFSVTTVFKPEPISEKTISHIQETSKKLGKLDGFDIKVLSVIGIMFTLWIASNWTGWDATAIAVLGLVLLFLPGIDALSWKEYVNSVSWNIVLLIGCVQSISNGIKEQGAASWLFGSTIGKVTFSGASLVGGVAAFLPILRLLIPVGPAFIAICLIPLVGMSQALGVSPVVFGIMIGINASTTFLLGVDANNMLSYRHGYWKLTDFFKAGIIPTIVMVVLHATLLVPLVSLLGY